MTAGKGWVPLVRRSVEEVRRRPFLDDLAVIHQDDRVGDFARKADLVGHDGQVRPWPASALITRVPRRQVRDRALMSIRRKGWPPGERQRPGDRDPLLLATGELGRIAVDLFHHPDAVQQLTRPGFRPLARPLQHVDAAGHDVREHAHMREQVEALRHHADAGAHAADHRFQILHPPAVLHMRKDRRAVEKDRTLVDLLEIVDHPEQRALARAARADNDHDLPTFDLQIDVAQHMQRPEALVYSLKADDRFASRAAKGSHQRRRLSPDMPGSCGMAFSLASK